MADRLKQIKPEHLTRRNEREPSSPAAAFVFVPLAEFDGFSGYRAFALAYEQDGRVYWFGNVDSIQLSKSDGYLIDVTDSGYVRAFPLSPAHGLVARGSAVLRLEVVRR